MHFVITLDEIVENIETFDKYIEDPAMQDFALKLMKEGRTFVAVKKEQGFRFYPSKFVGFKENSFEAYNRHNKDGQIDPSQSISQIMKHKPDASKDMEMEYQAFCTELGFTATELEDEQERKFWVIGL